MDILHSFGYIAGICTTVAFIPQVYRTYHTRHARDISYAMLLLLITGVSLWIVYGLTINEYPVIIANGFTLILLIILTGMKISFP